MNAGEIYENILQGKIWNLRATIHLKFRLKPSGRSEELDLGIEHRIDTERLKLAWLRSRCGTASPRTMVVVSDIGIWRSWRKKKKTYSKSRWLAPITSAFFFKLVWAFIWYLRRNRALKTALKSSTIRRRQLGEIFIQDLQREREFPRNCSSPYPCTQSIEMRKY